jgi:DNA topoisomerase-3
VAKDYARVLKCHKKTKNFFEGPHHVVTWALGHLVTLAEPHHYNPKYKEWRLEDLPMLPEKMKLQVIRKTSFQFRAITGLMKRQDIGELIIATDAGREGELVARWIMKLENWRKPFRRLWISSQTDTAILAGFASLKPGPGYNRLYDAAVCRAEADWLIGLNVTRALTCKFNLQLSAGRVQTPTLAMIINREREIREFVPRDFWTVLADFGDYSATWQGKDGNTRLFERARADEIVQKVNGRKGAIESIKTETKFEPPPLAYDLTELQRDANIRYGLSAQQTLSMTQSLYERHKLVTYPRTDSRFITRDMVPTLPQRLKSIHVAPYDRWVKPLLQQALKPGKRFVDDSRVSDHHAIIPTEQPPNLSALTTDERKVYDLIVRRFIAVLYPPHRYDQTTIVTTVGGEKFFTKARVVRDQGWRKVTAAPAQKEGDDEALLPEQILQKLQRGMSKPVKSVRTKPGKTQPPPRYTEATLLSAMESPGKFIEDEELRASIKQGGLGTPATRAEIIEKLLYNFYVERRGKELLPTSKGFQLVELVPESLRLPELTAEWELRLSRIARGEEKPERFMTDIRQNAINLVKMVKADTSTIKLDNVTKTPCPICGKMMLQVKSKKGRLLVCQDPKCGYRQEEGQDESMGFRSSSRKQGHMNKRMIDKYTDKHKKAGTTFGDLLESALDKKK